MSKKLNTSAGGGPANNTLFKYFAKSPAVEKKKLPATPQTPKSEAADAAKEPAPKDHEKENSVRQANGAAAKEPAPRKRLAMEMDSSDSEAELGKRKRKKVPVLAPSSDEEEEEEEPDIFDDDGDDEFKPDQEDVDDHSDSSDDHHSASEVEEDEPESEPDSPRKRNNNNEPKRKKPRLEAESGVGGGSIMEKLSKLQESKPSSKAKSSADDDKYEKIDLSAAAADLDGPTVWPHQKLEFLMPENIMDKRKRRPDHPDYDPSTLYVPQKFLDGLSPGVRQWWVLKGDNFDCVLFFKVGKFYELYHMDADVGVNELGFTYMRGEFAHSGFPEVSYDKMASILVDRGYKVARVEQTETPDMMTERVKQTHKPSKFDKVVRREICQITNRGTQVFGAQCQITPHHQPNYMLAVTERPGEAGATSKYGVCFIDTSIGDFHVGEFADDRNCSRLLTLISHHMPVLVLSEKATLSERTQQICRTVLGGVLKEAVPPSLCSAEKTLKLYAEQYYRSAEDWPLVLRGMQSPSDHLGLTPRDDYKLALKALGVCIAYMDKCHLEVKVLPMARYHLYVPPDGDEKEAAAAAAIKQKANAQRRSHMVLDAITLANLRITGEDHSLYSTLDQCCTKFGKRLLHHWLCAPSCDVPVIVERQQAVAELLADGDLLQQMRALMAPMPDFERHLAQFHLFGNKRVSESHPDGRAIMFEEKQYNKKKIQSLIGIIKGFETLMQIPAMFKDCSSDLLRRLTQLAAEGVFPDMAKPIEFFKNAFDHTEAAKSGVIAPEKGVDADYDECQAKIAEINSALKEYLVEQEKFFGCRLAYFGADKKRFQLDVPESAARKAGKSYQTEGQKKGKQPTRRFSTAETRAFLKEMLAAEDQRNVVLRDLARRIFEKFSQYYATWQQAVTCAANLDVLGALAEYARQQNSVCVPQFGEASPQPYVAIEEGYHPCVPAATYIPNGIELGAQQLAPLSLLTGPNMGGKSTLMRQVGLLVVMAQIGAHVPADSMRLSVVDRIFTRLGAQDDILSGHSTFLVELNETSLILKHATKHSLVLLDELGRGTATYDGTAIAASVVNFLAELQCRTLFSTHYHNLVDFFHTDPRITLGHMACVVENSDESDNDPTQETVTFLYKYSAGACPKSYGFNAAKLAGMPQPIIKRAYELSKKVEAIALQRKIQSKFVEATAAADLPKRVATIRDLLKQLKMCQI